MFIQVIQGKASDAAELRRRMEQWQQELMPGAVELGYLGTTAGFSDDGTFIALARFDSAEAAQRNSARPEQGEWWAETAKCFDGEVTFMNCDGVQTWLDGGSDDAGFVQVMEGRSIDVAKMHEMMSSHADDVHRARPEIIGGLMMDAGDGRYVDAIYFTSEEEARRGEQQEMPEEMRAEMEEGMSLMGDVSYFDLHEPMLVTGRK
jgi:hypothetical protein